MPRYFFNVYNSDVTIDEEGLELPSRGAAEERGRFEARYMAAESIKEHGSLVLNHHVDVTEADGTLVASISFKEAVRIID